MINLSDLKIHSLNNEIFGDLPKKEFETLKNDIKERGLQTPIQIALDKITVLCGSQRIRALKELDVKTLNENQYRIRKDLDTHEKQTEQLIKDNALNRLLTQQQIAEGGIKLEEIYKLKARERQKQGGAISGDSEGKENFPEAGQSRDHVGAFFKVSGKTYETIKKANEIVKRTDNKKLKKKWKEDKISASRVVNDYEYQQAVKKLKESTKENKLENIKEGDFFDRIYEIDNKSIDLIYVDPPYFISNGEKWDEFKDEDDYWGFTTMWLNKLLPKLKDTGRIYISFSQERMNDFINLMKTTIDKFDLIFENIIIWNYPNNIKPHDKRKYKYTWEPILYYRKRNAEVLNLERGLDTWNEELNDYDHCTIPQPQKNFKKDKKFHPTQKPLDLLRKIILTGSKEGDLILDPFAGSGTTGIVCRELNRNFILIEKNPGYVEIIRGRINGMEKT